MAFPAGEDLVEYELTPEIPNEVRGTGDALERLGRDAFPVLALPTGRLDCLNLDGLQAHPAISPFAQAAFERGAAFRLVRIPFSVRPPATGRVEEIRLMANLAESAGAWVHSIFPTRIEVEETARFEAAVEPSLKLGSVLELGSARLGRSVEVRQGRATTVGYWSEHGAEWLLRAPTGSRGVEGTWEMILVLQWPGPPTEVRLILSANATLLTRTLRWRSRRVEIPYAPISLTSCMDL